MINDDEYTYEVIDNESDALACAQLIAEEFAVNDPITVFDQVTEEYFFENCAWPMMKSVLDERLSCLARDRSSGEIVAVVCAGDMYSRHKNNPYKASAPPHAIAASDLTHELEDLFVSRDFGQELKPNMVLHLMLSAVRSQHANKGVSTGLYKATCIYAYENKGFQYLVAQITNPSARHIALNKMNGKEVTLIDPTTWQWKKKKGGLFYPYKDYKGGPVPNILVTFAKVKV